MTSRVLTRERLLEIFKCYEYLPAPEQAELTILKGHLLIEQRLREFILKRVANPSALDLDRLRFSQIMAFARSLDPSDGRELWTSIANLNQVRNKLAHTLDSEQLAEAINGFLTYHVVHYFQDAGPECRNLHTCIVSLYSSLVHLIAES